MNCTKGLYDNYVKVAIYARVSTTDQKCESQLRELRQYIARRRWKKVREYVDTGFSGSKAGRPALEQMMADAAQHKFDCVIVFKLDRFGRSVLHLNQQLAALTSYGIRFIATSQGLDTDQSSPTMTRATLHTAPPANRAPGDDQSGPLPGLARVSPAGRAPRGDHRFRTSRTGGGARPRPHGHGSHYLRS